MNIFFSSFLRSYPDPIFLVIAISNVDFDPRAGDCVGPTGADTLKLKFFFSSCRLSVKNNFPYTLIFNFAFQCAIKRTKHFELGGEKKRKGQMIQF